MRIQSAGGLSPDGSRPTPSFLGWGSCEACCRNHIYTRAKYAAGNNAALPERNASSGNVAFAMEDVTNGKRRFQSGIAGRESISSDTRLVLRYVKTAPRERGGA